jgi:CDP-diglyceride synthetase
MTNELRLRLLWALIPGSIALFFLLLGNTHIIFFVSFALALQGWREYSRMMNLSVRPVFHFTGYVLLSLFMFYSFYSKHLSFFWVWLLWIVGFLLLYAEPFLNAVGKWIVRNQLPPEGFRKIQRPTHFDPALDWTHLCRFVLGVIYVFMIFGFIGPLAAGAEGKGNLYLLAGLLVVFAGDSAAYFGGKAWGKRKLWPQLSPNKTIEGAGSGLIGSFLAALLIWSLTKLFSDKPLDLTTCLTIGLLCPPLGQAADFLESLMKRVSGRKDSGSMLPGHGGLLDRVDGLAFVMPLIYYIVVRNY